MSGPKPWRVLLSPVCPCVCYKRRIMVMSMWRGRQRAENFLETEDSAGELPQSFSPLAGLLLVVFFGSISPFVFCFLLFFFFSSFTSFLNFFFSCHFVHPEDTVCIAGGWNFTSFFPSFFFLSFRINRTATKPIQGRIEYNVRLPHSTAQSCSLSLSLSLSLCCI